MNRTMTIRFYAAYDTPFVVTFSDKVDAGKVQGFSTMEKAQSYARQIASQYGIQMVDVVEPTVEQIATHAKYWPAAVAV